MCSKIWRLTDDGSDSNYVLAVVDVKLGIIAISKLSHFHNVSMAEITLFQNKTATVPFTKSLSEFNWKKAFIFDNASSYVYAFLKYETSFKIFQHMKSCIFVEGIYSDCFWWTKATKLRSKRCDKISGKRIFGIGMSGGFMFKERDE